MYSCVQGVTPLGYEWGKVENLDADFLNNLLAVVLTGIYVWVLIDIIDSLLFSKSLLANRFFSDSDPRVSITSKDLLRRQVLIVLILALINGVISYALFLQQGTLNSPAVRMLWLFSLFIVAIDFVSLKKEIANTNLPKPRTAGVGSGAKRESRVGRKRFFAVWIPKLSLYFAIALAVVWLVDLVSSGGDSIGGMLVQAFPMALLLWMIEFFSKRGK
jgi:hypothetical protein